MDNNCVGKEKQQHDSREGDIVRETWGNRFDFAISCLGYAVGLANVWRFPFLCYKNGGGAFLVPYFTLLIMACIPLIVLEFAVGQYSSYNMVRIWRALPLMRGLAYCQFISFSVTTGYYNVVISYAVYYFFASLTPDLPWVGCDHAWNTPYCSDRLDACLEGGGVIVENGTCANATSLTLEEVEFYNLTVDDEGVVNVSDHQDPFEVQRIPPSEEYWTNELLRESASVTDTGSVVWQIALCNLFVWVCMFLIIAKGIKTSGKVVYFTALFPYIMITALLIRAVTLDGHADGIRYFVTPKWSEIAKPLPWKDAALQVFFSAGAGGGSLVTLSSYNKFHNTFINDALIVGIGNSLTSIYCGFTIFAILGYMAKQTGVPVKDVVKGGFGLVFVVCPAALAKMPGASAWSALFFGMLFLLALDSQFVCLEALVTIVLDEFPQLRKWRVPIVGMVCATIYITSMTYVTQAGPYWVALFDSYASGWISIISGVVVPLSFSWVYGFDRLKNDIRCMLGDRIVDHWTFYFWKITWSFVSPGILLVIFFYNLASWSNPEYKGPFPAWCHVLGWLYIVATLMFIPIVWVYDLVRTKGSFIQRLRILTRPLDSWGPSQPSDRVEAYRIHQKFGTTMAGALPVDDVNSNGHHVELEPLR